MGERINNMFKFIATLLGFITLLVCPSFAVDSLNDIQLVEHDPLDREPFDWDMFFAFYLVLCGVVCPIIYFSGILDRFLSDEKIIKMWANLVFPLGPITCLFLTLLFQYN